MTTVTEMIIVTVVTNVIMEEHLVNMCTVFVNEGVRGRGIAHFIPVAH